MTATHHRSDTTCVADFSAQRRHPKRGPSEDILSEIRLRRAGLSGIHTLMDRNHLTGLLGLMFLLLAGACSLDVAAANTDLASSSKQVTQGPHREMDITTYAVISDRNIMRLKCNGVLVAPNKFITASHCYSAFSVGSNVTIPRPSASERHARVVGFYPHPSGKHTVDLAVVEIEDTFGREELALAAEGGDRVTVAMLTALTLPLFPGGRPHFHNKVTWRTGIVTLESSAETNGNHPPYTTYAATFNDNFRTQGGDSGSGLFRVTGDGTRTNHVVAIHSASTSQWGGNSATSVRLGAHVGFLNEYGINVSPGL